MNKMIISLGMVSMMALLPAAAQAGQYEQRVITTTTILGATTGAIIGSGNDQTAQGAVLGALVGATAGLVLADNDSYRAYAPPPRRAVHYVEHRPAYRVVHVHRYGPREMVRVTYIRDGYGRPVKQVVHVHQARHQRYDRDWRYEEEQARNYDRYDRDWRRNEQARDHERQERHEWQERHERHERDFARNW